MYRAVGQIPQNGGWRAGGPGRRGNGIFGQVPTNGGWRAQTSRPGIFSAYGQFPAGAVYLEPAHYDDGGIRRIEPGTLPTFKWSINTTTTVDPSYGTTSTTVPGFASTIAMEVASVPFGAVGDYWLDDYLAKGYAILYRGKTAAELSPTLSFAVTKDPKFIATMAAEAANNMMVIDGPDPIISQAQQVARGGTAPSVPSAIACPGDEVYDPSIAACVCPPGTEYTDVVGVCKSTPGAPSPAPSSQCPPGTVGVPPACVPTGVIPGAPTTPPTPGVTCPQGQVEIYGECFNLPPCPAGEREVLGVCYKLPSGPGVPQQPTTPGPGVPGPVPGAAVAKTKAPGWLLPVLVGVAGVSVFALVRKSKKRSRL